MSDNDHDVLIELRTDMKSVKQDIKDIKENTAARISALEQDRVTQKEFHDHETRLRYLEERRIPRLENRIAYWAGGFAVLLIVIELLSKFYH